MNLPHFSEREALVARVAFVGLVATRYRFRWADWPVPAWWPVPVLGGLVLLLSWYAGWSPYSGAGWFRLLFLFAFPLCGEALRALDCEEQRMGLGRARAVLLSVALGTILCWPMDANMGIVVTAELLLTLTYFRWRSLGLNIASHLAVNVAVMAVAWLPVWRR